MFFIHTDRVWKHEFADTQRKAQEDATAAGDDQETKTCQECGTTNYDKKFYEEFQILICYACRRALPEYALITKSAAKADWLVTDTDLYHLPFMSKPNKAKPQWGNISLYVTKMVEQLSMNRYRHT